MGVSVPVPATAVLVLAAGVGVALYVWKKGGLAHAASSLGSAVVTGAGAAASGAVGAIGASVGLPTPDETTTDPAVARWLIDREGYFTASKWAGLPALVVASGMAAGSGTAPPPGSAIALAFPSAPMTTGDFARMDHDQTPVGFADAPALPGFSANDPAQYGIGL